MKRALLIISIIILYFIWIVFIGVVTNYTLGSGSNSLAGSKLIGIIAASIYSLGLLLMYIKKKKIDYLVSLVIIIVISIFLISDGYQ